MSETSQMYMTVASNFDLLPILDAYLSTYPDGDFASYRVLHMEKDIQPETPYTYLLFFEGFNPHTKHPLWSYLESWCTVNRGTWAFTPTQYNTLALLKGGSQTKGFHYRSAGVLPSNPPTK